MEQPNIAKLLLSALKLCDRGQKKILWKNRAGPEKHIDDGIV